MSITKETRRASFESLEDKDTLKKAITAILKDGNFTAREIALKMYGKPDRQAVAPRLTELAAEGKIEAYSKRRDIVTGRLVAVYRLVHTWTA